MGEATGDCASCHSNETDQRNIHTHVNVSLEAYVYDETIYNSCARARFAGCTYLRHIILGLNTVWARIQMAVYETDGPPWRRNERITRIKYLYRCQRIRLLPLQFFACQQKLHCLLFSWGDKHKVDSDLVSEPCFRRDIINIGNFFQSFPVNNMKIDNVTILHIIHMTSTTSTPPC
jgi:hypothetical protein